VMNCLVLHKKQMDKKPMHHILRFLKRELKTSPSEQLIRKICTKVEIDIASGLEFTAINGANRNYKETRVVVLAHIVGELLEWADGLDLGDTISLPMRKRLKQIMDRGAVAHLSDIKNEEAE